MEYPKVLFEDKALLVLNKPSGWVVNYVDSATANPILESWLTENFDYTLAGDKEFRSGIVHRLDKETSGVLVVAKTKDVFRKLQAQFKDRLVKKEYTALVHGRVKPAGGVVIVPIGRLPWRRDRFGVLAGGKSAETSYVTREYYTRDSGKEDYTLLKVMPRTGRTHQIRVHMKHLGYPIVSDEFYAGRKVSREDRKWCSRLFLHAKSLEVIHPISGETMTFKSSLPGDLQKVIKLLEKPHEN